MRPASISRSLDRRHANGLFRENYQLTDRPPHSGNRSPVVRVCNVYPRLPVLDYHEGCVGVS